MKPTAKTCHAMRVLLELAHHGPAAPLRATNLSAAVGISIKLLDKIVRPLKAAGLVLGVRGATGGYMLGREPREISLSDILTAMEGAVFKPQCCEADADCLLMPQCSTGSVWIRIADRIETAFRETSLADFMREPGEHCPARGKQASRTQAAEEPSVGQVATMARRIEAAPLFARIRLTRRRRKTGGGRSATRNTAQHRAPPHRLTSPFPPDDPIRRT